MLAFSLLFASTNDFNDFAALLNRAAEQTSQTEQQRKRKRGGGYDSELLYFVIEYLDTA